MELHEPEAGFAGVPGPGDDHASLVADLPTFAELGVFVGKCKANFVAGRRRGGLLRRKKRKNTKAQFTNPMLSADNEGQRVVFTQFLDTMRQAKRAMAAGDVAAIRALVAGEAGTGKSFVMDLIDTASDLVCAVSLHSPACGCCCTARGAAPS